MDLAQAPSISTRTRVATVDIVVPVFNEQATLVASVRRLHDYLQTFPLSWSITIVDNASTDRTWTFASALAEDLPGVRAIHLDAKGRGLALRTAWLSSASPVVAYMDVDLSTDLDALLPLVAPLVSGHSDVAIGTRLARGAQVSRGPRRELISRTYNMLLRTVLRAGFSDAQCGFKAMRADAAMRLLPLVQDTGWFFDTELLVLAEHNGLRIHEVPVDWIDDPDSRVEVVRTATGDLRGMWRMVRRLAHRRDTVAGAAGDGPARPPAGLAEQLVRFASIGLVSTVAYALAFVVMVGSLGPIVANVAALTVCATANAAANRRLTFTRRGRDGRARHFVGAAGLAIVPLLATTLTIVGLGAVGITSVGTVLAVLTLVNLVVAAFRFTAMRHWLFT